MTARKVRPPRTESDPLHWTCGYCAAEPGAWCRSSGGRRAGIHSDRMQAVRLWLRYGAHRPR